MDDAIRMALDAGVRYTGLRGFEVDPRLWHYLPLSLALRERVVPILLAGSDLTVAAANLNPDLAPLHNHFPNLTVHLAIAPAVEIDAVLARARAEQPHE